MDTEGVDDQSEDTEDSDTALDDDGELVFQDTIYENDDGTEEEEEEDPLVERVIQSKPELGPAAKQQVVARSLAMLRNLRDPREDAARVRRLEQTINSMLECIDME